MTVPQPFQYQGSKRALASLILQYLPISITRLVRVAQPSSAAGLSTVPVRVPTTGGSIKTRGGTPLQPAGGDACATSGRDTFAGLTPGATYSITVNAIGTAGASDCSNPASLMVV